MRAMLRRWWRVLLIGLLLLGAPAQAVAQGVSSDAPPVDVIELVGPMDDSLVDFAQEQLAEAASSGAQLAILRIDSPGVVTDEFSDLVEEVQQASLPVVAWVGPAPAVAYGGAAQLVSAAPLAFAAPGAELGYYEPTVAGTEQPPLVEPPAPELLEDAVLVEEGSTVVDGVEPTLFGLVVALDGEVATIRFAGRGEKRLNTAFAPLERL